MARKSCYSESHDESLYPKSKKRKTNPQASITTPKSYGTPPDTRVGFLPPNLSEDQRRELRAKQLVSHSTGVKDPFQPLRQDPLPDSDLQTDMEVSDPRGEYFNQVDGPVNTIFPVVNGPQFTHTKTRTLPEREIHPPLPEFSRHSSQELIAAVSADDKFILDVDNKITQVHNSLRSLRQSIENMARSVSRQDEDPGQASSPTSHASNIHKLITTIIEPWMNVLEEEFDHLLEGTEQHKALENRNQ